MKVASDSGPLIHLATIQALYLLKELYDPILITDAVRKESIDRGKEEGYPDALLIETAVKEGWIKVAGAELSINETLTRFGLNMAEAQLISFCLHEECDLVLLDDDAAREVARTLGLSVRGSIGVIIEARKLEKLEKKEALGLLDELSQVMYLSREIFQMARKTLEKDT